MTDTDLNVGPSASHEVCRTVGCSYRQLDYWTRIRLVAPSVAEAHGSGTQRRWTSADIARVRLVAALYTFGVPNRTVRGALDVYDRRSGERWLIVGNDTPPLLGHGDDDLAAHVAGVALIVDLETVAA